MIKDHLGNSYSTIDEMCAKYNLPVRIYEIRIKSGYTLAVALTAPIRKYEIGVKDHLGNEFNSIKAMCDKYNISVNSYKKYLEQGKSLEDILTNPEYKIIKNNKVKIIAPDGIEYESISDLCKVWNYDCRRFQYYMKKGYSVEDILYDNLEKYKKENYVKDHLGYTYKSIKSMCKHYNIEISTYYARIAKGASLEEALTKPIHSGNTGRKVHDHNGVEYPSIYAMCKHYNIDVNTYRNRIARGISISDALQNITKSTKTLDGQYNSEYKSNSLEKQEYSKNRNVTCVAPNGKIYNSIREVSADYGISYSTLKYRLKMGLNIVEALNYKRGKSNSVVSCNTKAKSKQVSIANKNNNLPIEKKSRKRIYSDHLGNQFSSLDEMCAHYNLTIEDYKQRFYLGLTLDKILTYTSEDISNYRNEILKTSNISKKEKSIVACDHLGKVYNSLSEMCRAHGIKSNIYYKRLLSGRTVEDTLNPERISGFKKSVKDHLGNEYISISEMYRKYGLTENQFYTRKAKGYSLQKILTNIDNDYEEDNITSNRVSETSNELEPVSENASKSKTSKKPKGGKSVCDHLGQEFKSITSMCEYWGINIVAYSKRKKAGWSLKDTLITPVRGYSGTVKDHLGNSYPSVEDMCNHYNITVNEFYNGKANNNTVKDILESKLHSNHITKISDTNESCNVSSKMVVDHTGQVFPSLTAMCEHWGVSRSAYTYHINNGESTEEALTSILNQYSCTDHLGNQFKSMLEMCSYWHVNYNTFRKRISSGYTIEESLTGNFLSRKYSSNERIRKQYNDNAASNKYQNDVITEPRSAEDVNHMISMIEEEHNIATYFRYRFNKYITLLEKFNITRDDVINYLRTTSLSDELIDKYILNTNRPTRSETMHIAFHLNLTFIYFIVENFAMYKEFYNKLSKSLEDGSYFLLKVINK